MKGFKLRRATMRDIDVLVDQRHRMYEDMRRRSKEEHAVGDRAYKTWALKRMRKGELVCFLAEDSSGRAVAGGCLWLREEQPGPGYPGGRIPYLMSMYTEPQSRRRGLASLVVKEAMRWSRKEGYEWMTLHASKTGRKVYRNLGWKRSWQM